MPALSCACLSHTPTHYGHAQVVLANLVRTAAVQTLNQLAPAHTAIARAVSETHSLYYRALQHALCTLWPATQHDKWVACAVSVSCLCLKFIFPASGQLNIIQTKLKNAVPILCSLSVSRLRFTSSDQFFIWWPVVIVHIRQPHRHNCLSQN